MYLGKIAELADKRSFSITHFILILSLMSAIPEANPEKKKQNFQGDAKSHKTCQPVADSIRDVQLQRISAQRRAWLQDIMEVITFPASSQEN